MKHESKDILVTALFHKCLRYHLNQGELNQEKKLQFAQSVMHDTYEDQIAYSRMLDEIVACIHENIRRDLVKLCVKNIQTGKTKNMQTNLKGCFLP